MDREHKKHMETVRLLITEMIMVLVIVVTAIVLTFVAMGYNLDKNGELGQSGLVQLRSFPSGASITVDGDMILPKTTASRMLAAGEHTIKLAKDGYDTWEKTITSESGRLLKLEYMRLFYQNRIPETMTELDGELTAFLAAPNRDFAVLIRKSNHRWLYFDLRGDDAVAQELDLANLLSGLDIKSAIWNNNSDKVLVKAERKNETEWLLINVKNAKESINLTKEFAMNFADIRFMTDSGDRLIALENGNLRTLALSGKTVSQVLAPDVKKFSFTGDTIAFLNNKQQIGFINGDKIAATEEQNTEKLINIALSEYIGEKYFTMTENERIVVYRGDLPNEDRATDAREKVLDEQLRFIPSSLKVYGNNQLIVARDGRQVAVYDCETRKLYQYDLDVDTVFLIDGYMVGEIVGEKLVVMDFDGTNKRELTEANSAAVITRNNKWLYYLRLGENKINLTREKIIE